MPLFLPLSHHLARCLAWGAGSRNICQVSARGKQSVCHGRDQLLLWVACCLVSLFRDTSSSAFPRSRAHNSLILLYREG